MFEAIEKKTGKRQTVYAVDGSKFLVDVDGDFTVRDMALYAPASCESKTKGGPTSADANCVFTMIGRDTVDLDEVLAGITSGEISVELGDMISTRLLDGTEVDFVVTDQDDKTVRFESRDCLGVYSSALNLDKYLSGIYSILPDALKKRIAEVERVHLDGRGNRYTKRCKLFLPAASEMFSPDECYGDQGLYDQLEWYKDLHNRVRAFKKGADAEWYWTSSPRAGTTTTWCFVSRYGSTADASASASSVAAPVCFHIPRI